MINAEKGKINPKNYRTNVLSHTFQMNILRGGIQYNELIEA
jgi:hypothetical protein